MLKNIALALTIMVVSWAIGTAVLWAVGCHRVHGETTKIEGRWTFFPDNPDWSQLK